MSATTKAPEPQVARAAGTLWLVVLTPGAGGWRAECRHDDGRVLPVAGGPWPVAPMALLEGLRTLEREGEAA